jgi:adenosine kinase
MTQNLIVTQGPNPTLIYASHGIKPQEIQVNPVKLVADPTGCGDAFRVGFLKMYVEGNPLSECVQFGHKIASLCIAQTGPQEYNIDDLMNS